MVRFDGVGLRYPTPPGTGPEGPGAPEALRDISFSLPEGSFHWLLGLAGAALALGGVYWLVGDGDRRDASAASDGGGGTGA